MKRCQFIKEEYYSNNENEKIALLCELNYFGKLMNHEENFFENIKKILQEIYSDLEGEVLIKNLG